MERDIEFTQEGLTVKPLYIVEKNQETSLAKTNEEFSKELSEIKSLLQVILSNQEQTSLSHQTNNSNRVLTILVSVDQRLYSIEEKVNWLKNGGKYLGDARGPSGIPGL